MANHRFLPLHRVASFLLLLIGSLLLVQCREKPPASSHLPPPDSYVWQILGADDETATAAGIPAKPAPVGLIARSFPAVDHPLLQGRDGNPKVVLLRPGRAGIGHVSGDFSSAASDGSPVNPATLAAVFLAGGSGERSWGMAPDSRLYAVKMPSSVEEIASYLRSIPKRLAQEGVKVVLLQLDAASLRDSLEQLESQLRYAGLSFGMHFVIPVPEEPSGLFALSVFPEGYNIHYISGLVGPKAPPARDPDEWLARLELPQPMAMGPGKNLTVAPSFSIPGTSALLDSLGWDGIASASIVGAARFCALLARLIQMGQKSNAKFSLHDYILALKTSARPLPGVPWYQQGSGIPDLREAAGFLNKMASSTPVFEFRNLMDVGKQGILIDSALHRQEVAIWGHFWPRNAGQPDTVDMLSLQEGISVRPSYVVANRVSRLTITVRAESPGATAPWAGMVIGRYRSNGLRVLEIPLLILPARGRDRGITLKP